MLEISPSMLERFESTLDPARPEVGEIGVKVLGYGEMSTVLMFDEPDYREYAFKRMALFHSLEETRGYEVSYRRYNEELKRLGLEVPAYGINRIEGRDGKQILYLSQERLEGHWIGNKAMKAMSEADVIRFVISIVRRSREVFLHNWEVGQGKEGVQLGLDMQISNWALVNFSEEEPVFSEDLPLVYIDTSTPLMRVDGIEQLDAELFLRICPSYLVWVIRWLFLKDVLERYYDFRLVTIDLLANFLKDARTTVLPAAIDAVNEFFVKEVEFLEVAPITLSEVKGYYKEDARIWSLFLWFRRLERFINTRLLGRRYEVILPGKIRR